MLIEHLIESVEADCIFPEKVAQHDNFFQPGNEYEKRLWESCREMAKEDIKSLQNKSNGGKKSAEIRKQKKDDEVKVVSQPLPTNLNFTPPTKEEVLTYAREMDNFAGMGGFPCTKAQAIDFYNHYSSQGWISGNGVPIRDWKRKLPMWVKKDDQKLY